jgi:predicted AAA+ superfamily ATPase
MPHLRQRYLESGVRRALTYSPVVGVLGQRQVGKTTLLESICSEYQTFDDAIVLAQATADAALFLNGRRSVCGVDEAQLCPPLFPALKEWVRTHRQMGQFLLSGSVRFTSKKTIRESLTGRVVSVELLPFTIAEAANEPLPDVCDRLLQARSVSDLDFLSSRKRTAAQFRRFLETGGMPGVCFIRDAQVRAAKFEAHLDTLLNRDVRQVYPTTLPFQALRSLLSFIARQQGRAFEWAEAARASQISRVTLKRVMEALEALFLLRFVPALGTGKSTVYLEDQGMASYLKDATLESADDVVRALYANLRQEIHYRPERGVKLTHWSTRNDVEVPLVFQSVRGRLGILATLAEQPSPKTLGSAQAFLRQFPGAKVVVAYGGKETIQKSPAMIWSPYWQLV